MRLRLRKDTQDPAAGFYLLKKIQGSKVNRRNILVERWNKSLMSLSTVSKSLKALEEDLIIDRKETIRLLQPAKLLEKLSQNYASPNINERIPMKVQAEGEALRQLLRRQSEELGLPITNTTMLGALLRAREIFPHDMITEPLKHRFGRIADKNIKAFKRAYSETQILQ